MLTNEQILEAIEQMKIQCDLKMANYEAVSARSVLNELGYEAHATQVLEEIARRGFNYCLDHEILCNSGEVDETHRDYGKQIYPPSSACYWGPDQLKSRLNCLHTPR